MSIQKEKGKAAAFADFRRYAISTFIALTVAALLVGCGNRMDTAPLIAGAIVITTPDGAVPVAGTMQFVATVTDASGNVIALSPVWTVTNGGGTITRDGLFTAGDSAGTFVSTITATSGAVSSTSSVTVSAGALATFKITPDSIALAGGATQHFVAVGRDAHGNVVALSAPVTWTVATGGGSIDSAGMFTAGLLSGTFAKTVVATSSALADSATIVVLPGAAVSIQLDPGFAKMGVGDTVQFAAFGVDANLNRFAITPVWTVVAGGGTITSTGLFIAGTVPGFYSNTVRAVSGSLSASASLIEFPGPVATFVLTPDSVSIAAGATQQFTAVLKDSFGNVVQTQLSWTVSGDGGSIDGAGLLTAGSTVGSYIVTARITQGTMTATSKAVVTAAVNPLVRIAITPMNPTITDGVNTPFQFTATGYDTNDNVVPILPAPTWGAMPQVGTIDSTGLLTANPDAAAFFANAISATSGNVIGTASVTMGCGC